MVAKDFFSSDEQKQIVAAIKEAELNTSGEIRVHVESKLHGDVLDHASKVFAQLKMHKTELRNGVLFFLAVNDKQFAILGDAGINSKVPENFWDSVKDSVISKFKTGEFANGLADGILLAGEQLKKYFPYQTDDVNELDDEISFSK